MNTKAFLEQYNEIGILIENNWKAICRAYDSLNNYGFSEFTINGWGEISIESEDCYRNEYDYGHASIPLDWFESEEVLQTKLAEVIKENEEEKLHKKKEEEEKKAEREEKEMEALQKILDEYYKTHPRKPAGGNFH